MMVQRILTMTVAVALVFWSLLIPTSDADAQLRKPPTTAASATNKRPKTKAANNMRVGFRMSPQNRQKMAELRETRKNVNRPLPKTKRRKSGNNRSDVQISNNSSSSRNSRRDARNFNDPAKKRYGQRDLPAVAGPSGSNNSRPKSMRSSVSSVLSRQPTPEN